MFKAPEKKAHERVISICNSFPYASLGKETEVIKPAVAGLARERCSGSTHPHRLPAEVSPPAAQCPARASGRSLGASAWAEEVSGRAVGGPLRSRPARASVSPGLSWPWAHSPGIYQALTRGRILRGEPDGRCRAGAAMTREQTQTSRRGMCHSRWGLWGRGTEAESIG